ncbi:MAG: hypothetical protein EXQ99_03520 [Alphaproteobacteria bacterium]|nr:hypothetical protein [Alphaproteobacteria bacterium]
MDVREKTPPRRFAVGHPDAPINLTHCADIALDPDEQVTFVTQSGTEFDVVRKAWGYYAASSLDTRLPAHGLRPVLCRSGARRYFLLAEKDRLAEFHTYLRSQSMEIIAWLDADEIEPVRPSESRP